ncbi:F0F1 ATP synthase subunit delta [Hydrogenobacter hydrogenophilus]|uniref:F-type H+-transporting ATPase subunit delta n=1 Tax=Hydrogenobacter hydrogenophilus TaxID=35835 RepID=A0A285P288_9AQUI|nr:F0F1 ATP synthase subunit delta [Hydrogenobacter hydrogenophilus]SNZ15849.1 F-type H+-transporting ATPase subunit delta [Hydrogenobacter hydrogenophilus]
MINKTELSRKISRTLISSLPKDRQSMVSVSDFLGFLSELYRKERTFKDFMLNPLIPVSAKLSYLNALREKFGLPKELEQALSYIVQLSAFPFISQIKHFFDHEVEKTLRFSKAFLILAQKTDESQLKRIRDVVSKMLSRDLEFEVIEDKSLIGGFVVKTYGFVLDASIKKNLQEILRS